MSAHMTSDSGKILNPRHFYDLIKVSVGDGSFRSIKQVSKAFLHTDSRSLLLSPVYHVPNHACNLLLVSQLCHTNSCAIDVNGSSFPGKDQ